MNLNITKNDKKARILILLVSALIVIAIVILGRVKVDVDLGFDEHLFAKLNAFINTIVAFLFFCFNDFHFNLLRVRNRHD